MGTDPVSPTPPPPATAAPPTQVAAAASENCAASVFCASSALRHAGGDHADVAQIGGAGDGAQASGAGAGQRRVSVVGIGSGGLDQVTVEAVRTLQTADFAIAAYKRQDDPLFTRRVELLERHAPGLELVGIPDPERDRSSSSTSSHDGYRGVVLDWHSARALAWEEVIASRPGDVVIPVWGDPAFYDSTLRILDRISERGRVPIEVQVLPGISALQVLAARHGIVLHEIGGAITVITGRRLREAVAAGADNVVVMLNSDLPLDGFEDWRIWWGGNLGDAGETLVSGLVGDVLETLRAERDRLRDVHGWVMDVYLLRRGRTGA